MQLIDVIGRRISREANQQETAGAHFTQLLRLFRSPFHDRTAAQAQLRDQLTATQADLLALALLTVSTLAMLQFGVTEWEWPHIRCEILVERDSQKGIVIGRDGGVLKEVGIRVRRQLPEGAFLELFVKVDKDWQSRPKALERLGY